MTRLLASLIVALGLPLAALAQGAFPEKPVRFIVPFPPGGGTDALARVLATKLGEMWGQQVIVDNRAGAQGNIGTAAGAKATPDGYTITFAHQGALVINPHMYRSTGYDTLKDFTAVARTTEMAFIVVAHPSVPATTLKELADYARRYPNKLTFASTSAGPQIVGELFRQVTGTDLLHVPYKGAGPAITDLLGGQVTLMFSNPTSTVPHVKSGKLRALAVMDSKRNPAVPDVPSAL
ncbi:MAG TPA: tripartite tricarboxylate transporter substrate binding protein, partial [Burkholderiales bacterium]|nr:tripartite tricarboxylate transporter substrate binding protein [Burkholderiales bacterium]